MAATPPDPGSQPQPDSPDDEPQDYVSVYADRALLFQYSEHARMTHDLDLDLYLYPSFRARFPPLSDDDQPDQPSDTQPERDSDPQQGPDEDPQRP